MWLNPSRTTHPKVAPVGLSATLAFGTASGLSFRKPPLERRFASIERRLTESRALRTVQPKTGPYLRLN